MTDLNLMGLGSCVQALKRKACWLRTIATEHEKGLASAVPEQLRTVADDLEALVQACAASPVEMEQYRAALAAHCIQCPQCHEAVLAALSSSPVRPERENP